MSNYIISGTDLTAIANAIRAKSGGSSPLEVPDGFVSEVQAIPSGGSKTLTKLTDLTISGPVSTISITATDAMNSCDRLFVNFDAVTLSAQDWLYPYINGVSGTQGSSYMGYLPDKKSVYNDLFDLLKFVSETIDGKTTSNGYQYAPAGVVLNPTFRSESSLTSVDFRTYTGGVTFNSGTIEIWGYV